MTSISPAIRGISDLGGSSSAHGHAQWSEQFKSGFMNDDYTELRYITFMHYFIYSFLYLKESKYNIQAGLFALGDPFFYLWTHRRIQFIYASFRADAYFQASRISVSGCFTGCHPMPLNVPFTACASAGIRSSKILSTVWSIPSNEIERVAKGGWPLLPWFSNYERMYERYGEDSCVSYFIIMDCLISHRENGYREW